MPNMFSTLLVRLRILATFKFKDFDPNEILNGLTTDIFRFLCIAGVFIGGVTLILGFFGDDPKKKSDGIATIIGALVLVGSLIGIISQMI